MKWTPLIALIFGLALLAYYKINEPKPAITIRPAPHDSLPLVRSPLRDPPTLKRTQGPHDSQREAILIKNFLLALESHSLDDQSHEHLSDNELMNRVNEWSGEMTNELAMPVDHIDLGMLGFRFYADLHSPFARYLALDWATRGGEVLGDFEKSKKLILQLSSDPAVQMGSEPFDERTEERDERIQRVLGTQMIETQLRRIWINLNSNERKLIVQQLKETSSDGSQRILSSIYSWGEEP